MVFILGVSDWKRSWFQKYEKNPIYLDNFWSWVLFYLDQLDFSKRTVLYIWSYSDQRSYRTSGRLEVVRVEDGFFRSKGLGSNKVPAESLIFDSTGYLYFDGVRKSAIDQILCDAEFSSDDELLGKRIVNHVVQEGCTKYNLSANYFVPKSGAVLVIGQVEDDLAIKHGCGPKTNIELVELAVSEHPLKDIYFKRHPDVVAGNRREEKDFARLKEITFIIDFDVDTKDLAQQFVMIYVNTSLMGFELLLREGRVRVAGRPFYWGLGLTSDLQERIPMLNVSIEKLVYAAYYLYPTYTSDSEFKKTLDRIF